MDHRGLGVMGCNDNGDHGTCLFILNISLVVGLLQKTVSLEMTVENESILASYNKRRQKSSGIRSTGKKTAFAAMGITYTSVESIRANGNPSIWAPSSVIIRLIDVKCIACHLAAKSFAYQPISVHQ